MLHVQAAVLPAVKVQHAGSPNSQFRQVKELEFIWRTAKSFGMYGRNVSADQQQHTSAAWHLFHTAWVSVGMLHVYLVGAPVRDAATGEQADASVRCCASLL